jgi:predicted exporter
LERNIQVDILALLPQSEQNESLKQTQNFIEKSQLTERLIILLGHKDPEKAHDSLQNLRLYINEQKLPIQEQNSKQFQIQYHNFFKRLYPYRTGLLDDKNRMLLLKGHGATLAKKAFLQSTLPFSTLGTANLKEDPFFLFPQYVQSLIPLSNLLQDKNQDTYLIQDGVTWYLFHAQLRDSAFSISLQEKISLTLVPYLNSLKKNDEIRVLKAGAVFYAIEGFKQAKSEISNTGTISSLAIIALVIFFFRSLNPLFLAITVIIAGTSSGIFACLSIFGSIHLIALLFGCSLIGITIDYVVHYFCVIYKTKGQISITDNRLAILEQLIPAILLGVLSSALGYAILCFIPFPGVQQLAVIGSAGILSAFVSLALWGPYLAKLTAHTPINLFYRINQLLTLITCKGQSKVIRLAISILCLSIFAIGAFSLTFDDDIRSFQTLNKVLKQEEDTIKVLTSFNQPSQFAVIKAHSVEELLQKEELIIDFLLKAQENIPSLKFKALSQLVPSQKRQNENKELIERNLYATHWKPYAQAFNINPSEPLDNFGLVNPPLALNSEWIKALPEGWKELIDYKSSRDCIGLVSIINSTDLDLNTFNHPLINPVSEYEKLFRFYRHIASALGIMVLTSIIVILSLIKGFIPTIRIITPVILSILATIGCIGLLHIPFTLFHTVGTLLVLCIGIDYALFLYWRKAEDNSAKELDWVILGNMVCAITTILSFGCLAFTQTKATHDFGLYVSIGIALCFLNSTLFLGKKMH